TTRIWRIRNYRYSAEPLRAAIAADLEGPPPRTRRPALGSHEPCARTTRDWTGFRFAARRPQHADRGRLGAIRTIAPARWHTCRSVGGWPSVLLFRVAPEILPVPFRSGATVRGTVPPPCRGFRKAERVTIGYLRFREGGTSTLRPHQQGLLPRP